MVCTGLEADVHAVRARHVEEDELRVQADLVGRVDVT
jgi:hypothetical protein